MPAHTEDMIKDKYAEELSEGKTNKQHKTNA
jgi:hypothetical protein